MSRKEKNALIFGKHINKYYLKYLHWLLLGIFSLLVVDVFQLKIPEFYNYVVSGIADGSVTIGNETLAFDLDFLLDKIYNILMIF